MNGLPIVVFRLNSRVTSVGMRVNQHGSAARVQFARVPMLRQAKRGRILQAYKRIVVKREVWPTLWPYFSIVTASGARPPPLFK